MGGYIGYENDFFRSFLSQSAGSAANKPHRKEFGPTTAGLAAIEWLDDGQLRVEAKDDSNWQGIVIATEQDDWVVRDNKGPSEPEITLDPLTGNGRLNPKEHRIRVIDREIESVEVQPLDWVETVSVDFAPEITVSADYDIEAETLEIDMENTGPCAIKATALAFGERDNAEPKELSGAAKPGDELGVSVDEPWPENETACALEGESVQASVKTNPKWSSDLSYTIQLAEDKSCTTIVG